MSRHVKLFFIFLLMLSSALIGVTVFADDYGLGATAQEAGLAKYESNLPKLVGQVVGAALSLTGVLFFGLMIYSGIIWMIDRGNDERAEQAKNTITAAIIGLVIVLAAYAITKFAFEAVPQSGGGGNNGGTGVSCSSPNQCLDAGSCDPNATGPFPSQGCTGGTVCCPAAGNVSTCSAPNQCMSVDQCDPNATGPFPSQGCTGGTVCCPPRVVVPNSGTGNCSQKTARNPACEGLNPGTCGNASTPYCTTTENANNQIICIDKCAVTQQSQCDSTYCVWTPQ